MPPVKFEVDEKSLRIKLRLAIKLTKPKVSSKSTKNQFIEKYFFSTHWLITGNRIKIAGSTRVFTSCANLRFTTGEIICLCLG